MRIYLIRRLLLIIPTVFLTTLIIFFAIRLIPGSVIDIMEAQLGDYYHVPRTELAKRLGLDVPIIKQYGRWIGVAPQADGKIHGILEGDFGQSIWHQDSVLKDEIGPRVKVTAELTILGLIVGLLIALPIGIFSALRQDTWGDYASRTFAILCIAIPSFWLGTLVIVYPSIWWNWTPSINYVSFTADPVKNLEMFILPAVVLGMSMAGVTMRMMRTMMLEVLRQDYVRTAWAKGLRERVVVMRHALKNALIPVITIVGMQVSFMIGGDVIIEQIFNLPGLGRLLINSTQQRDYSVVQGIILLFAIALVVINLLIDLTYGYFDPRVSYK
jgi:peptide/nickel transport system permease protein